MEVNYEKTSHDGSPQSFLPLDFMISGRLWSTSLSLLINLFNLGELVYFTHSFIFLPFLTRTVTFARRLALLSCFVLVASGVQQQSCSSVRRDSKPPLFQLLPNQFQYTTQQNIT